jgi:Uma2 family endonuclease
MTIEEMNKIKNYFGFTYDHISKATGIPLGTVQKVLGGITKSPRHSTMLALEEFFSDDSDNSDSVVAESVPLYGGEAPMMGSKKPGEYTVKDYFALPEDQRAELIDGVFYDMCTPSTTHQIVGMEIWYQIRSFIKKNKGKCVPLVAPCAVQLDMDDKTIVEPDVMIICDRNKIVDSRIYGAPDFIVEVMSKSTKRKDMTIKLTKYENAGVKEYWLVEPYKHTVVVYDFAHDHDIALYNFDEEVPVGIYDGELKIDFRGLVDEISYIKDEKPWLTAD